MVDADRAWPVLATPLLDDWSPQLDSPQKVWRLQLLTGLASLGGAAVLASLPRLLPVVENSLASLSTAAPDFALLKVTTLFPLCILPFLSPLSITA